jgi:hypothetical protein
MEVAYQVGVEGLMSMLFEFKTMSLEVSATILALSSICSSNAPEMFGNNALIVHG